MSGWGKRNTQFQYVANTHQNQNKVSQYTSKLVKSDIDKVNGELILDYEKVLKGGCIYLPNYFCSIDNLTLFNKLIEEIDTNTDFGLVKWSKHFKHENPTFSETFNDIIKRMADYFKVEVLQTRLNYYKDGTDWKPFHHDSHAYTNSIKEDFTMGASFGTSRELEFLHESTGNRFKFPQNNGDIFAFTSEVNKKFMHGVPKVNKEIGPRISIIAWGKRYQ